MDTCPNCGYCEKCGRGRPQYTQPNWVWPTQPYYVGDWPYQPVTTGAPGRITITTGTRLA